MLRTEVYDHIYALQVNDALRVLIGQFKRHWLGLIYLQSTGVDLNDFQSDYGCLRGK